jgi:transcriptional regulator with XRE-family HTH domain
LDTLLAQHGIHRPADLADVLGVSLSYAWQLLHGRRKFTTTHALRLYHDRGVPIHALLEAQVRPTSVPRGRRLKHLSPPKPPKGKIDT